MKKLTMILFLITVAIAGAQTSLITPPAEGTSPGVPFNCDVPQDHALPFTFYQFVCRGVPFNNADGNPDGKLFWFTVLSFYGTFNDVAQPVQGFGHNKYKLDYYTNPANGNLGTYAVEFQFIDANNLYHYGVWSGTFMLLRDRRGESFPQLQSSRIDNYQESATPILN